jgi:hypothetical protein
LTIENRATAAVVVLLKREDCVSTYRVGVVPPASQKAMASEDIPGRPKRQASNLDQ